MNEIPKEAMDKIVELACLIQRGIRRARMESPLKTTHSERMGDCIVLAEQIEHIGRRVLKGRIGGNGEVMSPLTQDEV